MTVLRKRASGIPTKQGGTADNLLFVLDRKTGFLLRAVFVFWRRIWLFLQSDGVEYVTTYATHLKK